MEGDLVQFAILFGVLGIAAAVAIWLRFPVVPLYIAAGVVLGLFMVHNEVVGFLGLLGVVFLLFSMGHQPARVRFAESTPTIRLSGRHCATASWSKSSVVSSTSTSTSLGWNTPFGVRTPIR